MRKLIIIQGDNVEEGFTLEGESVEDIESVRFVCESLGLNYTLNRATEPDEWLLNIPGADTADLRVGRFRYNLVVTFNSGRVKTIAYQQYMEVLLKDNKWTRVQ